MANQRLQVPLDSDTYAAVKEYSEATGMPLGRACAEVLQNTAPILRELAKALRTAKTAPAAALRHMSEEMDKQIAAINQHQLDLSPKATLRKYRKKTS
jgi:putative hemolysin